jgi:hypothetical protein
MTDSTPTICNRCRGRGYVNEPSNDPHGQSFDTLFALLPVLGIGFILLLLYLLGFISFSSMKSGSWFGLIGGFGLALLIAAGCLHTIWKMIFPRKIECLQCKGRKIFE